MRQGEKMAGTKYGQYFTTDCVKSDSNQENISIVSTRHLEKFGGGHLSVDSVFIKKPHQMLSRPHKHEFPQYLHFFSANPDDATDFDAEIEISLGEEQEKHIVNEPTAIYIPAGLPHGPVTFTIVNKPFLFVDIAVTGKYTRVGNTPD
jgi:hypothetical protein